MGKALDKIKFLTFGTLTHPSEWGWTLLKLFSLWFETDKPPPFRIEESFEFRAEYSNLLNFGIDLPQFGIDSY